jgi:BirA family biotin operon repressor/biotin-[acetyl-CoA-carboxylase] ligase
VVAEGQTAGRGRLGRRFHSPPYLNLYTSIVLRPDLDLPDAPAWTLASAVAVAEAVAETLGDEDAVEIKWPNDVLVDGRKTCGILLELAAEATRVAYLVLGIGVNLNVDPATFPRSSAPARPASARALGRPIDRAAFARALFARSSACSTPARRAGSVGYCPVRGPLPHARTPRARARDGRARAGGHGARDR